MARVIGQDDLRGSRLINRQRARHEALQGPASRREIQRHGQHEQPRRQARPARRQHLDPEHGEHGHGPVAQAVHHVPGPGKREDEGRGDPQADHQSEKDRRAAPGLGLGRQDAPAALTGQQRKPEYGPDRVFLRRAHERKGNHHASKNGVHG